MADADEFDGIGGGRLVISTADDEHTEMNWSQSDRGEEQKMEAKIEEKQHENTDNREPEKLPEAQTISTNPNWPADGKPTNSLNDEARLPPADGMPNIDEKLAETVKWEELDGGIVVSPSLSSAAEGKAIKSDEQKLRGFGGMETSDSSKAINELHGVHNFLTAPAGRDVNVKRKKAMLDKATCVLSRPIGVPGLDEHLMGIRPGTNLTIDITIICKTGNNTLYISAKWKGREYYGVLTDGEALFAHSYAQKRSAAHSGDKVYESVHADSANNGGGMSGQNNNAEKIGGMSGKRGGKRGGGQSKNIAEKRAKNQELSDSVGVAGNKEGVSDSNAADKGDKDNKQPLAETSQSEQSAESKASPTLNKQQHAHSQHGHRRTSSSSTSTHPLFDGSQLARVRCPHPQCGYRFESVGDLNTHFLVGFHGTGGSKAKIFESSATQTSPVESVSVGCDPCFTANKTQSKASHCAKCQKELAGGTNSVKAIRPNAIDYGGDRIKRDAAGLVEDSPGFSDISDEVAPTLEKEECYDKQNDETKKASAATARLNTITPPPLNMQNSPTTGSVSSFQHCLTATDVNAAVAPPKCASPTIQQSQPAPKELLRKTSTAVTPKHSATVADCSGASTGPLTNPYLSAEAQNVAAAFQFGPLLQFGTQLQHVFNAMAHQQQSGAMPAPTPSLMSPPSGASSSGGLLSLGTPLVSVASTSATNHSANSHSKSAEPPSHPPSMQHKIYELQHPAGSQNNHLIARASSTKPSQSSQLIGGAGQQGGCANSVSPVPPEHAMLIRPNSAISSMGQQQPQRNQQQQPQLHSISQHQLQPSSSLRPMGPNAPSPIAANFPMLPGHHPNPFFPALPAMFGSTNPQNTIQQQQQIRRSIGQMCGELNNQQQSTSSQQQPQQTTQLIPPFMFPAGISPSMLAAAAPSLDLQQQYAALMASTSNMGAVNTPSSRQHPNLK